MAEPVRQNDVLPMGSIPDAVRPDRTMSPSGASSDVPLSIDDRSAAMSPARRMQQTLGREFAEVEDQPWSQRRTIAFVALTCGAFWTCVYFVVAALVG